MTLPTHKDEIIDMIESGALDDDVNDLQEALRSRIEARRAKVLAEVHAVYGANAEISVPRNG